MRNQSSVLGSRSSASGNGKLRTENRKGGLHTLEAIIAFLMILSFIILAMPNLRKEEATPLTRSYVYESLGNLEKNGKLRELAVSENLSGIQLELGRTIMPPLKFTVGLSKMNATSGTIYPKAWLPENATYAGNATLQRGAPQPAGNSWTLFLRYASKNVDKPMEIGGYFSSAGSLYFVSNATSSGEAGVCNPYNSSANYWWAHIPKEPGETYNNHTFSLELGSSSHDPDLVSFTINLLERRSTNAQDSDCSPLYNDTDLAVSAADQLALNDGRSISGTPYTLQAAPSRAPGYINFTANASTLDSATLELEYTNATSPIVYLNGNEMAYHAGEYSGRSEVLDIASSVVSGQNTIAVKTSNNATIAYRLRLMDSVELEGLPGNKTINTVSYILSGSGSTFKPMEIRVYVWK